MDSSENQRSFEQHQTPQGDGGKPTPQAVTNSIYTGAKIVPVRKKNVPFIKNDEFPTPTYSETRHAKD